MASAPPLETAGLVGTPQPPSYEEAMIHPYPQYPPGAVPAPHGYAMVPQQPYPMQAPVPPVTSPVVSVQTIYVQPGMVFGDQPVQTRCPACTQIVVTRLEFNSGVMAWLTCAALSIFGCIYGCCLIPFCVDGLKDVTHHCPNCNSVLGIYKRL
ncbi:lipopolysaccharide-induced tumor necrosis factor-alpha factor homolog [Megalops cyprinoides]|uniref:lipopolysaccharide-induced tumor necrosis factor-alpha factor homolog n=1 Tax=Megalops cyprinoides TaxID=118141 RepID=UPI0018650501|nr:lipopolysaccharide-induced tumor necrosis factor-alpha factor homolog [Megalops cyprinoides]XP_036408926.1 lipopolysaccharide-induced tumor necrosis factor-alpha factor homolog [Megalops cyprinoides]